MSSAALEFFNKNYQPVVAYMLLDGTPRAIIGTSTPRKCRYCGRSAGNGTTFRMEAHAVPELIGNRWLFAGDECDNCNRHFSSSLEDHLAKYLGLGRTLSQIKGKDGVPQVGRSHQSHIKLGSELEIHQRVGDEIAEIDFEKKEIRVAVPRQPYVPVAVYKALAKMAYAIMPEDLCLLYSHLPAWLLSSSLSCAEAGFKPLKVLQMFVPGPMPIPGVRLLMLRRRDETVPLPCVVFVVAFANYCFQVPLPALPGDLALSEYDMYFFPANIAADERYGRPSRTILDLTDESIVRDHQQRQTLTFESYTEVQGGKSERAC